nr:unnamed protein product [Digitaria exilis]
MVVEWRRRGSAAGARWWWIPGWAVEVAGALNSNRLVWAATAGGGGSRRGRAGGGGGGGWWEVEDDEQPLDLHRMLCLWPSWPPPFASRCSASTFEVASPFASLCAIEVATIGVEPSTVALRRPRTLPASFTSISHDVAPRHVVAQYKFSLLDLTTGAAVYELPTETGIYYTSGHGEEDEDYYHYLNGNVYYYDDETMEEHVIPPPVELGCGYVDFIAKAELERWRETLLRDDSLAICCDTTYLYG